eukprot:TRINITY_DN102210_c0_g1_i1.p1 TRINITY_DN102210_c0_g1~~TRINITY_DN102210_c0_g1_i1.p1  ORF type:complete len:413 (+),score=107.93 TRINITY_DN102210_c0_g1_i1:86-1324(+)
MELPETTGRMPEEAGVRHAEFLNQTAIRAVRPSVAGEAAIKSIPRSSVPGLSLDPLLLGMGLEFKDCEGTTSTLQTKPATTEETASDEDSWDDEDDEDEDEDADEDGAQDTSEPSGKSDAEIKLQQRKARRAELATKKLIRQRQREAARSGSLDSELVLLGALGSGLDRELAVGFEPGVGAGALVDATAKKKLNRKATKKENKHKKLGKGDKQIASSRLRILDADLEEDDSRSDAGVDAWDDDGAGSPKFKAEKADEPDEDIFSPQMIEETLKKMNIVREQCLACTIPYADSSQQRAGTTMRSMLTHEQEQRLQEDEVRVRRFLRWEEEKRQDAEHAQNGLRKARAALGKLNVLGHITQVARRKSRDFEDTKSWQSSSQSARNPSSQFRTVGQAALVSTRRKASFSAQKEDS